MKPILKINDLHVSIEEVNASEEKEILKGVTLALNEGQTHAIMGPNGSGKSTLALTLMGHPRYTITNGTITFEGKDLAQMAVHERAAAGVFLGFQNPFEIEGVTLREFLYQAYQAKHQSAQSGLNPPVERPSVIDFEKDLVEKLSLLSIRPAFVERHLNVGFSGGQKKLAEVLQLALLQPKLVILDEIDSGLDVDALKTVCSCINKIKEAGKTKMTILVITHYPRILHYLTPDAVHVMQNGVIAQSGDKDLAQRIEASGYFGKKQN